jgi:hypothetical protein
LSPKRISCVATVSFSFTIGRKRRPSRRSIGALGVAARRGVLEVTGGEQHLPGEDLVPVEDWSGTATSARSGRRRRRPAGSARSVGRPSRWRNGIAVAIAPDDTSTTWVPRPWARGDRVDEGGDLAGVGAADRRRSDLDDDALGAGHLGTRSRHSSSSPSSSSGPVHMPALRCSLELRARGRLGIHPLVVFRATRLTRVTSIVVQAGVGSARARDELRRRR